MKKYTQNALEMIAARELKRYCGGTYLFGRPRAIPEDMPEKQYGLTVEYHTLRRDGSVLGQTVFGNCFVPIYDTEQCRYTLIEVTADTLLLDNRLLLPQNARRLRFTLFHEFAHWLLHRDVFLETGQALQLEGGNKGRNNILERQADRLCASLLMPRGQVKKAFYALRGQVGVERKLADLFMVSRRAMVIRLEELGVCERDCERVVH